MAGTAVVILGNFAAGDVHVRLNRVGTVSLCRRHFRRNGYRDAGLCDRQLDNENAWRSCNRESVTRDPWPVTREESPAIACVDEEFWSNCAAPWGSPRY